jgi:hypothetical protein
MINFFKNLLIVFCGITITVVTFANLLTDLDKCGIGRDYVGRAAFTRADVIQRLEFNCGPNNPHECKKLKCFATPEEFNKTQHEDRNNFGKNKTRSIDRNVTPLAQAQFEKINENETRKQDAINGKIVFEISSFQQIGNACRVNFQIKNNRKTSLRNNSLIGFIVDNQGRKYNWIDSNIGPRPNTLISYRNLQPNETISNSVELATYCDSIVAISDFGFFDVSNAVKDGFMKLDNIDLYSPRKITFNFDDFNSQAEHAYNYQNNSTYKAKIDRENEMQECRAACQQKLEACVIQYRSARVANEVCGMSNHMCFSRCN